MAQCVVDASVVAKWFLEEEFSEEARQLHDDYAADLVEVIAPSLLPCEVLNALRFTMVFSSDELEEIAKVLDRFSFTLHPLESTLSRLTVGLASSAEISVYDASYAAAQHLNVPLFSADDRLLKAVSRYTKAFHVDEYRTVRDRSLIDSAV